ncbi:MAG: transporter [Nitrospira sp.]|nr:transporter [Nitrospira sp.]
MDHLFSSPGGQANSSRHVRVKGNSAATPAQTILIILALGLMLLGLAKSPLAHAAEGAGSNYYPGTYGDLLVAAQPKPGTFSMTQYTGFISSKIDQVVINNRAHVSVDVQQAFLAPLGLYTLEKPILGGATFSFGGFASLAAASLQSTLATSSTLLGSPQSGENNAGIGTSGLIPAYLSWKFGEDFSLSTFEVIYMPTGGWDPNSAVNLNRGYWGFDTNLAFTFFHEKSGTELSATGGLMANTTNPHTQYWTAPEFHLEYVFNQFVTNWLSVGLHGYFYTQVANDDPGPQAADALALLRLNTSAVRSESYGLGPQVNWVPKDNLFFGISWIHDLYDHYRLPSNYYYCNLYVQF